MTKAHGMLLFDAPEDAIGKWENQLGYRGMIEVWKLKDSDWQISIEPNEDSAEEGDCDVFLSDPKTGNETTLYSGTKGDSAAKGYMKKYPQGPPRDWRKSAMDYENSFLEKHRTKGYKKESLKWDVFAGGTAAEEGKHSYQARFDEGEYDINPVSSMYGRHQGYRLYFVNSKGVLPGGLWQVIGMFRSPNKAKAAAMEHHNNTIRQTAGGKNTTGGYSPLDSTLNPKAIDIDQVKHLNQSKGQHWFDKDTLRFFRSRFAPTAYLHEGKAYFVSSEQFVPSEGPARPRKYSIRVCDMSTGGIKTIGEFQAYDNARQATADIKKILTGKMPMPKASYGYLADAQEALRKAQDDKKAGHKDAEEYWKGQAAAFFTAGYKGNGKGGGSTKGEKFAAEPRVWKCQQCGRENYASHLKCPSCGAPQLAGVKLHVGVKVGKPSPIKDGLRSKHPAPRKHSARKVLGGPTLLKTGGRKVKMHKRSILR